MGPRGVVRSSLSGAKRRSGDKYIVKPEWGQGAGVGGGRCAAECTRDYMSMGVGGKARPRVKGHQQWQGRHVWGAQSGRKGMHEGPRVEGDARVGGTEWQERHVWGPRVNGPLTAVGIEVTRGEGGRRRSRHTPPLL